MLLSDVASAELTNRVITARTIAIVLKKLNRYTSNSSSALPRIVIFVNALEINRHTKRTLIERPSFESGDDLLSRAVSSQVPSAC